MRVLQIVDFAHTSTNPSLLWQIHRQPAEAPGISKWEVWSADSEACEGTGGSWVEPCPLPKSLWPDQGLRRQILRRHRAGETFPGTVCLCLKHCVSNGHCLAFWWVMVKLFTLQISWILNVTLWWGCSSVGRASDWLWPWLDPDADLIPWCGNRFFSQGQLSVQTLFCWPYTSVCNRVD